VAVAIHQLLNSKQSVDIDFDEGLTILPDGVTGWLKSLW
jgi:hypothetical protein